MSGFKVAVRHSESKHSFKRQRSSHSTSSQDGYHQFQRQVSNQSTYSENVFSTLSDHLSHFSLEDIPAAAHPSPLPTRKFDSPSRDHLHTKKDTTQEEVIFINNILTYVQWYVAMTCILFVASLTFCL